jgi:hypothetical protein
LFFNRLFSILEKNWYHSTLSMKYSNDLTQFNFRNCGWSTGKSNFCSTLFGLLECYNKNLIYKFGLTTFPSKSHEKFTKTRFIDVSIHFLKSNFFPKWYNNQQSIKTIKINFLKRYFSKLSTIQNRLKNKDFSLLFLFSSFQFIFL